MQQTLRALSTLIGVSLSTLCFADRAALAESYPERTVKILVGYSPGLTANDAVARVLAPRLQEILKQPFVIENRPGAAGTIAEELVARSAPDGYTLLSGTSAITVNAALRKGYTNHKTLKPIAVLASSPVFLFVRADSPYRTVDDLVAKAKASPDMLTFGTTGVGSSAHLVMEIFQSATNTKLKHIPYKGAGDVVTGVLAGDIDIRVAPYVPGDTRFKALLALDTKRVGLAPDVASASELGLKGFFETFYGTVLLAPAETSPEIVDLLYRKTKEALVETPELKAQLAASGSELSILSPEKSAELMNNGINGWTGLVRRLGISID